MGNCGVGFAPCKPADREKLVELMEGVEDIPGPVMHEGLKWEWESFSEYLDALDRRSRDIDICALLPHAAVRVYVMGDRAIDLEPANQADIAAMRSEEHTSELQSLMRISYAVFCLKKKNINKKVSSLLSLKYHC